MVDEKEAKKKVEEARKNIEKENNPQTQGALNKAELELREVQEKEAQKSKDPKKAPPKQRHFRRMDQ